MVALSKQLNHIYFHRIQTKRTMFKLKSCHFRFNGFIHVIYFGEYTYKQANTWSCPSISNLCRSLFEFKLAPPHIYMCINSHQNLSNGLTINYSTSHLYIDQKTLPYLDLFSFCENWCPPQLMKAPLPWENERWRLPLLKIIDLKTIVLISAETVTFSTYKCEERPQSFWPHTNGTVQFQIEWKLVCSEKYWDA